MSSATVEHLTMFISEHKYKFQSAPAVMDITDISVQTHLTKLARNYGLTLYGNDMRGNIYLARYVPDINPNLVVTYGFHVDYLSEIHTNHPKVNNKDKVDLIDWTAILKPIFNKQE